MECSVGTCVRKDRWPVGRIDANIRACAGKVPQIRMPEPKIRDRGCKESCVAAVPTNSRSALRQGDRGAGRTPLQDGRYAPAGGTRTGQIRPREPGDRDERAARKLVHA